MWWRNIFRRNRTGQSTGGAPGEKGALSMPAAVWHQLDSLQLSGGRFLPGRGSGQRRSFRRKPHAEFHEHRMYVPGDDVRFVDWRASARQEQVFIKQGEQPKENTVYFLLDCSASMSWGAPPKHQAQRALAAALGYSVLAHEDRLVVVPLAEAGPPPLGPLRGKGQLPALFDYLQRLPLRGQVDVVEQIRVFSRRTRTSGLVLVLSDLIDVADFAGALDFMPPPIWEVVFLHLLHPDELEPPFRGNLRIVDIETNRRRNCDIDAAAIRRYRTGLTDWRAGLERQCDELRSLYTLIRTDAPLATAVIPQLVAQHILRPRWTS